MDTDVTPGNFHISGAKIYVDNVNIGSLNEDGAIITYAPDIFKHNSAKFGSTPIAMSLIGIEATVELHIGETTQDNLLLSLAGASEDAGKVVFGGAVGSQLTGVELLIVPFDDTESWVFHNAVPTSSVEVGYTPKDKREFVVTFQGMIDVTTEEVGQFGSDVS